MKLFAALSSLLLASTALSSSSNSTHYPLFPPLQDPPPIQLLHTSLATLLPILPLLSPPPSHTLLLTLATPAFKPLLFNWICFLRYKARYGEGEGSGEGDDPKEVERRAEMLRTPAQDILKLLVVTSDEGLARELTEEHGVVVWWLRGVDWEAEEANAAAADDDSDAEEHSERIARILQDDLFTSLRSMDLLLPPTPPSSHHSSADGMLPWGTLHYQSLMLERSLVLSALTGALVESQKKDREQREKEEREWREQVQDWDWIDDGILLREKYEGIKGVLLVDNDAVWLSSPIPQISHHYRPHGPHPSLLYAPDMTPTQKNAWGGYSVPCACFIYSRVDDHDSHLSERAKEQEYDEDASEYLPADGAALAWRWTAICHISMLLKSLEKARELAAWAVEHAEGLSDELDELDQDSLLGAVRSTPDDPFAAGEENVFDVHEADGLFDEEEEDPSKEVDTRLPSLSQATAPSFQSTSLGPALYLASRNLPHTPFHPFGSSTAATNLGLPYLTHAEWMRVLAEGGDSGVESLEGLLELAGMGASSVDDEGSVVERQTCDLLARRANEVCAAPLPPLLSTTLTRKHYSRRSPRPAHSVDSLPLPYQLFPPGMLYFNGIGGLEKGDKACVVHANYATGAKKEELLRERGLWALGREAEGRWTCDAVVLRNA